MLQPNTSQSIYTIPDLTAVIDSPALLGIADRLLLYSLIISLQPTRVLEIGTNEGGSAQIIRAALEYVGQPAKLATVDIAPKVLFDEQDTVSVKSFVGNSPDMVKPAAEWLGGVDFAFVDGDHEFEGVMADVDALRPYFFQKDSMGYALFHDIYYKGVADAIEYLLSNEWVGCLVNRQAGKDNKGNVWGGMALINYGA